MQYDFFLILEIHIRNENRLYRDSYLNSIHKGTKY